MRCGLWGRFVGKPFWKKVFPTPLSKTLNRGHDKSRKKGGQPAGLYRAGGIRRRPVPGKAMCVVIRGVACSGFLAPPVEHKTVYLVSFFHVFEGGVVCGENFCKSFPHTPFKNLKQGVRQKPEEGRTVRRIIPRRGNPAEAGAGESQCTL